MESDMRFEGQVAIVTGAGRGIGRAIALRLANEGARVACVSRTEENVKKVADEINDVRADVAKPYAVDVTNHDALAMRMSLEGWEEVLNTNLRGAFSFTQSIIRAMTKQRSGRIINISSVIGLMGNAGQTNYAASK